MIPLVGLEFWPAMYWANTVPDVSVYKVELPLLMEAPTAASPTVVSTNRTGPTGPDRPSALSQGKLEVWVSKTASGRKNSAPTTPKVWRSSSRSSPE